MWEWFTWGIPGGRVWGQVYLRTLTHAQGEEAAMSYGLVVQGQLIKLLLCLCCAPWFGRPIDFRGEAAFGP